MLISDREKEESLRREAVRQRLQEEDTPNRHTFAQAYRARSLVEKDRKSVV